MKVKHVLFEIKKLLTHHNKSFVLTALLLCIFLIGVVYLVSILPLDKNRVSYPLHRNISATVFWVGEEANKSNDFIDNKSSAWASDWVNRYGGVDDPRERCEWRPCDFIPKENSFYAALPFGDYTKEGLKPSAELAQVPWYKGRPRAGESILKNRWIKIYYKGRTAYAQWEDVGPFEDDDAAYVFGSERPKERRAGIDLSPATADYLNINGRAEVNWQFAEAADVPPGPWREIITRSGTSYE